jgi:RNA polymerase sigma-70 factor (ECF subfamily)
MDGQPLESRASAELDRAWREHRRHLLDIALRMLGNLAAAEDAVQEAFARLARADVDEIEDVAGWLVVVVSRVCLDVLRTERRHPSVPGDDLGDARPAPGLDPAERVTLDDQVRLALHVVLERLTPAERTAFVLHDVFQYSFDAIAEIVGRTPAACRQLASRARRAVAADAGPTRFRVEPAEQRRVVERFIAAATEGDLDGLLAVLDPDVTGAGDGGGAAATVRGAAAAAEAALFYVGPQTESTLLSIPLGDDTGIVVLRRGRVAAFLTLTIEDGLITHVDAIVRPARRAAIAAALGL